MKIKDKTTVFIIVFFVLVITGMGIYSRREKIFAPKENKSASTAPIVRTERAVFDKTVAKKITQNMSIDAENRVKLLPRVTGRLVSMSVKVGQNVKRGMQIAVLEHDQQSAEIEQNAAQRAAARADSEKANALMMQAKSDMERYERLEKNGFSTRQQVETKQTEYKSAAAAYRAALANEHRYAAETARLKAAKSDYIITAPIDGVVLNDYDLTSGAMISPSSPVVDIADMRTFKATLKVAEMKIFAVKIGMPVFLRFDAIPNEDFEAHVSRIDQYIDPSTRTGDVEIIISNSAAQGRLRPGMFGEAWVIEEEYKNSLTLPESALHSKENGYYVFAVKDGHAEMREVTAGVREHARVHITSGIKAGEEIIVFGGANLNPGDAVEVQNQ